MRRAWAFPLGAVVAVLAVLAVLAVVAVGVAGGPAAAQSGPTTTVVAAPEAASLTVAPDVDLVDGQVVTLTGAGFDGPDRVQFSQCPADATSSRSSRCIETRQAISIDGSGSFQVEMVVRSALVSPGTPDFDCRQADGACVVWADRVSVPLTFDPDAPLLAPPTLSVTPSTGLVDGQLVHLVGEGYFPSPFGGAAVCLVDDRTACLGLFIEPLPIATDGRIDWHLSVPANVLRSDGTRVPCGVDRCLIEAGSSGAWGEAPVSFAPEAPPAEPVPAAPAFTG